MSDEPSGAYRVLVTGAAGFIGCHLVERLVREHGCSVRGVDNERSGSWERLEVPCERVNRDICALTVQDFADLCRDVDVVFHLAAEKYNSSKTTPERVIAVNISATQRLFEGAALAAVKKLVFASSLYAYGGLGPGPMRESDIPAPTTVYGMSKLAGEHLLRVVHRDLGFDRWTVARLFFVYGGRQHAEGGYKSVITRNFERLANREPPVVSGDGRQSLDYTYVEDVVSALMAMVDQRANRQVLNVGSGRAIDVNVLTERMIDVAGVSITPIFGPPDWTAGTSRFCDPSLAYARLGWRATTPIDRGLAEVWKALQLRGSL